MKVNECGLLTAMTFFDKFTQGSSLFTKPLQLIKTELTVNKYSITRRTKIKENLLGGK